MDGLQYNIHSWAERTFIHDQLGIAAHILSEAAELYKAAGGSEVDAQMIVLKAHRKSESSIPEETADIVILSMTMAGFKGFSLDEQVRAKMEVNYSRKWGEANELGFTEHAD